jgi:hypothetical protein
MFIGKGGAANNHVVLVQRRYIDVARRESGKADAASAAGDEGH